MSGANYNWRVEDAALAGFLKMLDEDKKLIVQVDFDGFDDDGETVWRVTIFGSANAVVHTYLGLPKP